MAGVMSKSILTKVVGGSTIIGDQYSEIINDSTTMQNHRLLGLVQNTGGALLPLATVAHSGRIEATCPASQQPLVRQDADYRG